MCNSSGVQQGWAVGVATCDGVVAIEYFDEDGVSEGTDLPAGWQPCLQGEQGPAWAPSHSTLTFASPTPINFTTSPWYRTLSINGNLTLTGSSYVSPADVTVRIIETGGASRTLTFPSGWVWVTAKPTNIAANKTAILNLVSFGTAEADVVARYWVQS